SADKAISAALRHRVADIFFKALSDATPGSGSASPFASPVPSQSPAPPAEPPLPDAAEGDEVAEPEETPERASALEGASELAERLAEALAADSKTERDFKTRARSLSFNMRDNKDLREKLLSPDGMSVDE
ncbi:unnamed protein product, partial [Polarella glacialis]